MILFENNNLKKNQVSYHSSVIDFKVIQIKIILLNII